MEDFIGRLTGKQTMYQMIEFADQIRAARRHAARSAGVQEACTWTGLHEKIRDRIEDLRDGGSPEKYLVPGARALLEVLASSAA